VTEQQLTRRVKRRLAILRLAEEVTGHVALTCRYYGISRQVVYTWRRRYDQHGLDGLWDRSRRPRSVQRHPHRGRRQDHLPGQRYGRHDRRWRRFGKPLPGHRVQIDVKFLAPLPGSRQKHYSSPPSTTAPAFACCGSLPSST
jgi:hypothetical protein